MCEFGTKDYFEKNARLTLIYLYDANFVNLEVDNKERPDIQSEKLSIGIEVVRAIDNNMGLTSKITIECFEKKLSFKEISEKVIAKKHFKGSLSEVNGMTIISPTKNFIYDTDDNIAKIKEKILFKLAKLNSNDYNIFDINGLYIFSASCLVDENKIKELLYEMPKEHTKFNRYFDMYFINCIDKLYIYDCSKKFLEKFELSAELRKKIDKELIN